MNPSDAGALGFLLLVGLGVLLYDILTPPRCPECLHCKQEKRRTDRIKEEAEKIRDRYKK